MFSVAEYSIVLEWKWLIKSFGGVAKLNMIKLISSNYYTLKMC